MVFGAVIKSLKTHLLDNLAVDMKTTSQWLLENFSFRWVLTYPTTWGDNAKEFLKLSAKQVGVMLYVSDEKNKYQNRSDYSS